jgi:hypothetical protein
MPRNPQDQFCDSDAHDHARLIESSQLTQKFSRLVTPCESPEESLRRWAESGAMWLTGSPDEAPSSAGASVSAAAHAALNTFRELAGSKWSGGDLDGAALLAERAAIAGLSRGGVVSCGGAARLLRCTNGWLCLNLARAEDVSLLPAWLENPQVVAVGAASELREASPPSLELWQAIDRAVENRDATELVDRGRMMGMAVSEVVAPDDARAWCRVMAPRPAESAAISMQLATAISSPPLVVDLSSLWAGPLASHLLGLAGARVIKVEDVNRPDGARRGPSEFFDLLNAGKESVSFDFRSQRGRESLLALIRQADIVIEASRPRALRQLGLDADELVCASPHLVWVSITGYGREHPNGEWVAFGDDAAVAGGLAMLTGGGDSPLFCADAVADPLTGIFAALGALKAYRERPGVLLDIALRDVAAVAGVFGVVSSRSASTGEISIVPSSAPDSWVLESLRGRYPVQRPVARKAAVVGPILGADNDRILGSLGT